MKRLAALLFGMSIIAALLAMTSPASAVEFNVTGAVTSSRGTVTSGQVEFYAACTDATPAAYGDIVDGTYYVTISPGTYRVLIKPIAGYCTVKKNVVTAKKKGTCRLSAKAPGVTGYTAFSKRYTIRVK